MKTREIPKYLIVDSKLSACKQFMRYRSHVESLSTLRQCHHLSIQISLRDSLGIHQKEIGPRIIRYNKCQHRQLLRAKPGKMINDETLCCLAICIKFYIKSTAFNHSEMHNNVIVYLFIKDFICICRIIVRNRRPSELDSPNRNE